VSNHRKGLLIVGLGVITISPDALLIRLLHMDSPSIVFWRGLLMSIGFLVLASVLYRGRMRARVASIGRFDLAVCVLNGLTNILFVTAITHTAVANTLVILAASPVFGAVLSSLFLGDRIRRETWAACLVILAGVAVIVHGNLGGPNLRGDLAAFGASLCTSSLLVVLRRRPGADPVPGITMGSLLSALLILPAVGHFALTGRQFLLAGVLGLVLLPVAIGLITHGPAYLTAPEIGLMTLLETVLGPLWVWLAVGEEPSRAAVLCGALIVAVLAVHSALALRGEGAVRLSGPV